MHFKVYNGNEEEKRFDTYEEAQSYVWNALLKQDHTFWTEKYGGMEHIRPGVNYGNQAVTFDCFDD